MPRHIPARHFRRGNIFYFRQVIPADLREHFPTRELCFSLGTEKSQTASSKAIELSAIMHPLFNQLREPCMTKEKSSALIEKVRHAAEKIRLQARHEEREDALLERLITAYRTRKETAAQHAVEIDKQRQGHAATVEALTTQHAKATAAMTSLHTPLAASTDAAEPVKHSEAATAPKPAMLISELAEYVLAEKKTMGEWNEKTSAEYLASINLLIGVIGDKPAGKVTPKDSLDFIEAIKALPTNINKNKMFAGKTISQIIEIGGSKTLAPESVKKRIERVSTFFELASEQGHSGQTGVIINVFKGRAGKVAKKIGVRRKGQTSREVFSDADIADLLYGEETQGRTYNNPYHYWLIPLGLLTGARINELCQLHLDDFKIIDGVWCIDINNKGEGKRTKTEDSTRIVPLHKKLIELGLLQYIEALRSIGKTRLFPELKELRDGYGQAASKWFNRHRTRCGITTEEKVFHSFRHTFTTRLIYSTVPDALVSLVVGHRIGEKSMTNTTYLGRNEIKKLKDATIDKLTHFDEILNDYPAVHEVTLKVNRKDNFWKNGRLLVDSNFASEKSINA